MFQQVSTRKLKIPSFYFPQPQRLQIHPLQRSHIDSSMVSEEIRVYRFSTDAGAARCTKGVGDPPRAKSIRCHAVFAGEPGYVRLQGVDH